MTSAPPVSAFELRELAAPGHVAIVGSLRLAEADRLRVELLERREAGVRVLDLSEVEHLDAGAAAILAEVWNLCACDELPLELRGARDGVREILECFLEGTPIREPYQIVTNGKLAGAGAHAYSEGNTTKGSEEAVGKV